MISTHFSNVTNTSHLSHQSHLSHPSHLRQFLPVVVTVVTVVTVATAIASMLGKACLGPPFNSDNSLLGSWKKSRHVWVDGAPGAMVPWSRCNTAGIWSIGSIWSIGTSCQTSISDLFLFRLTILHVFTVTAAQLVVEPLDSWRNPGFGHPQSQNLFRTSFFPHGYKLYGHIWGFS